jgi:DNA-binding MarR family transcriptional regulator
VLRRIPPQGWRHIESHLAYHANEKRLLSALSAVSEERVGEFFRGAAEDSAIEALGSLGLEINSIEECTFGMSEDGFIEMAKDREMTGETCRVLFYLLGKMDFENYVRVTQGDAAAALGLQKTNVSRAVKTLCDKGILLKGPKAGRSATYRLNSAYGWKGKVKNFESERRQRFKLLNGGKGADPAQEGGAAGGEEGPPA